MRDALPNATYLGFTGTPIEKTDVNTPAVFGNYVDIYDISQAVEDGATVRIFYESRLAKIAISEEGKELIEDFDDQFTEDDLNQHKKSERSGQESKDSLVVKNVSKPLPKTS
jgi:type I restriction enzyme R subunit